MSSTVPSGTRGRAESYHAVCQRLFTTSTIVSLKSDIKLSGGSGLAGCVHGSSAFCRQGGYAPGGSPIRLRLDSVTHDCRYMSAATCDSRPPVSAVAERLSRCVGVGGSLASRSLYVYLVTMQRIGLTPDASLWMLIGRTGSL